MRLKIHLMGKAPIIFCWLSLLLYNLSAQQVSDEVSYSVISKRIEKQLLTKAGKTIEYNEYDEAVSNYSEQLRTDSANFNANYALAITFYSNFHQLKSISLFERALRHTKDPAPEAHFFLANSYHLSGNYDKAEQTYKTYLSFITSNNSFLPKEEIDNAKNDVLHRIAMCQNGKRLSVWPAGKCPLLKDAEKIGISYIGNHINSQYDDYGTVFSPHDSTVFFTSKRADEGNVYFSRLKNNEWIPGEELGWPINTKSYEAIINVSPDGKRIYFYRSGIDEGLVYYSDYYDGRWGVPILLLNKYEINTTFKDTRIYSFAITPAKDELFIVSDRQGGKGGKDIYGSKKVNDSIWGPLENLGAPINTAYDEVGLSLSADGNTMYFSSNGSNSIGGFDVFFISRTNGKWTEPASLGIPINTPGDDLFFSFLHNSKRASYSSSAYAGRTTRDLNIYFVDFCDDVIENTIKGLVKGFSTGTVKAVDLLTQKEVSSSPVKDGKYIMNVGVGKQYNFIFETEGIKPVYIGVTIPEPTECKRYDVYQEITFKKPGDTLKFRSALLDIPYQAKNPDITSYSLFLDNADKRTLKNYSERNVLTYLPETAKPAITTVIYDSISGKEIGKVSFDSEKGKIKEAYDKEVGTAKAVTTFSFSNILFDFDKSRIKEIHKAELDKAVEFLLQVKPDNKIEIGGYSDSKGNSKHNLILSKQRANAVAKYFVSKKINKNRITVVGYGEKNPIAPNTNADGTDNKEGRAKNRRTEIVIK